MIFKNKVSTGVAVITPFKSDGSVDYVSLGKIINYLIESKVDFLVALGTTGETSTLTKNERKKIFRIFKECNNFRVPLLMGIGGNDTSKVINDINEYYVNDFGTPEKITVHADVNSMPHGYSHRFNNEFRSYVEAMGFKYVCKPNAWAANTVANWHTK